MMRVRGLLPIRPVPQGFSADPAFLAPFFHRTHFASDGPLRESALRVAGCAFPENVLLAFHSFGPVSAGC